MQQTLDLFNFLGTGYGILALMVAAGCVLVLWDWRVTLAVLVVLQWAMTVLLVRFHAVVAYWMMIQTLTIGLCVLSMGRSAWQAGMTAPLRQRNNLGLHLVVILFLVAAWFLFGGDVPIPVLNPALSKLCLWLAAIAFVMMSMANDPMSVGAALLLWLIPAHALAVLFTPIPVILALLGLMELAVGLGCAYLILTDRNRQLLPTTTLSGEMPTASLKSPPPAVAEPASPPLPIPPPPRPLRPSSTPLRRS